MGQERNLPLFSFFFCRGDHLTSFDQEGSFAILQKLARQ